VEQPILNLFTREPEKPKLSQQHPAVSDEIQGTIINYDNFFIHYIPPLPVMSTLFIVFGIFFKKCNLVHDTIQQNGDFR
jgi:hypothetical protein